MMRGAALWSLTMSLPMLVAAAADQAVLTKTDIAFIAQSIIDGMVGIKVAELALTHHLTAEEQTLAQGVMADLVKGNRELVAIARSKHIAPPDMIPAEELERIRKKGKSTDAHVKDLYMKDLVSQYTKAVQLFESEQATSTDEDLTVFTATVLPRLQARLATAKSLTVNE